MPLLPFGVHEHFPGDPALLTPLFKQYVAIKAEQPAALLLYRLGDFYELFGPDAVHASELLGLTLTSRACYKDYKVAMCGIPHHSSTRYIKRLVAAGEAVAVCDQMEDPALAKGLVTRAVTRVITAGTLIEDEYLAEDSGNYLAVVALRQSARGTLGGVALFESSSGRVELFEGEWPAGDAGITALTESALRQRPAEVLLPEQLLSEDHLKGILVGALGPVFHGYHKLPSQEDVEAYLQRHFNTVSLASLGIGEAYQAQAALFALIRYLKETFRFGEIRLYPRFTPLQGTLYLDRRAISHLQLLDVPGGLGSATGTSLFGYLNCCATTAGRRELKRLLAAPHADRTALTQSHDAVEHLVNEPDAAASLKLQLGQLQDVERILNRIALGRSHPKELRALVDSLPVLDELSRTLSNQPSGLYPELLLELSHDLGGFTPLHLQLDRTLAADPPVRLAEGGVIRDGADPRVDELRGLAAGNREWIADYEQRERERTGIRSLKIKSTESFGFFIEVGKASAALVPQDYKRRQTLVSAERYTTPELQQRETDVRNAEGNLLSLEKEIYEGLCETVMSQASALAAAARAAARLDVLCALAETARTHGWTRAEMTGDTAGSMHLLIENGRHPLVEQAVGLQYYTPNTCYLSQVEQQLVVLTGPNMGGKSTYLRMVAIIMILNQLGGFVPASKASLPVLERIYTRVGAQDYLARGQSTFMVEMVETAEILNTCHAASLVILDEVGRGTSTYDGISIAKAVVEYLHEHPARPLTLFATHFFELTDLALLLSRVANFQVEVARDGGTEGGLILTYRVIPGAASESYGIEVAALAGLPPAVVERARVILGELEEAKREARERARQAVQLRLFQPAPEP